jgi:hypothetical protein
MNAAPRTSSPACASASPTPARIGKRRIRLRSRQSSLRVMFSRTLPVSAGFAAVTLLAACGGTTTASSSGGGGTATTAAGGQSNSRASGTLPDACTLLSQEQAAQMTGDSTVAQTPRDNAPGESTCTYDGTGGGHMMVLDLTFSTGVSQSALQRWVTNEFQGSGGQPMAVSGIGGGAYQAVGSNEATLAFGNGTTLVVIDAQSMTRAGASMESDIETLAKADVGRL